MTDPVIQQARKLRDSLLDVAKEHDIRSESPSTSSVAAELAKMDAQTCRSAAEMLAKLGTEVTRLRLGIGHFDYGQMPRRELVQMSKTWNSQS